MMNRGIAIQYGDVAPEAKENFVPVASESKFNTLSQLMQYNLNFPNYANPCELYSVVLDGTATAFPSVPEDANLGLVSEQISNEDGTFAEPIVLELESTGQYSSQGLTFTFDTQNNIYPIKLNIKWFRDTGDTLTELGSEDFYPDNAFYFCRNLIENYNKIIITVYSINMPKNRLRLRAIDYGYGTFFYGKELRNANQIQELDPLSTEISINTFDFVLDSKTDMVYSFQAKQPLIVYFNGNLISTNFVKSSKRNAKFLWDVKTEDYIGIMDSVPFYGGVYSGKDAYELLVEIFTVAKVPYLINENLKGVLLYGYIPITTSREALMQVAFAVQNVVDTSNSDKVKVFELDNDIKQTIPLTRIYQGQNFDEKETVTGVDVVMHTYTPINEKVIVYEASESGTGNNILIQFSEPLHSLEITNGEFVSDISNISNNYTNYIIVNANENCVVYGYKYDHTTVPKRKNNPVVLASELEKIVSIENATLISTHNIDNVLDKCYNWLTKTNTTNLKIVEGKHIQYGENSENIITYDEPVNIGENINAETEYLGIVSGRIIKQSFNLNGNILVKEAVLK